MNLHRRIDHLFVGASALIMRRAKFFRSDTQSDSLGALVNAMRVEIPAILGEGQHEPVLESPVAGLDPAYLVAQWRGPEWPCLIYHHGNNERPFDFGPVSVHSFKTIIMRHRATFPANIIALRAPFHDSFSLYLEKVARLENFAAMVAASTVLAEGLIRTLRAQGCPRILLCGTSLGGFVTNLHRACFDMADRYAPIMAGPALDEIFLSGAFNQLLGPAGAANPNDLKRVLNHERAFAARRRPNIKALMMRHDAIVDFERQSRCLDPGSVQVVDRGHTTGAFATARLRSFVLDCLRQSGSITGEKETR